MSKRYKHRVLSFKVLCLMEGQKVVVHDLAYDNYDQICEVTVQKELLPNPNSKSKKTYIEHLKGITLENDEYIFQYNELGQCQDGDFVVYAY